MQRKEIAGVGIGKIVTGAIIIALALGVTIFYLFYTAGSEEEQSSSSRLLLMSVTNTATLLPITIS